MKNISTTMPTLGHHIANVVAHGEFKTTANGKQYEIIKLYDKTTAEEIEYQLFDGGRAFFFNHLARQTKGACWKNGREDTKVLDYFKEFDLDVWCDINDMGYLQCQFFEPRQ